VDLWVHFSPEIGSPAVASRSRPSSAGTRPGLFFEAGAPAAGPADAASLQDLGMLQFPQAPANGRAAQPGDQGQPREAATTGLQCEGGGDQPTTPFVGEGEELVQGGVLPGDSRLGMFAALGAGTAVRNPAVILWDHDELTRVEETRRKVSLL
jgi:hypothetical protein